ncbi:MAG TPA: hypothetical protein VHX11_08905 [Acidobacteriaceae bacterium]|jgi:hypothetical protein|nr:hypothetical protein [Acidobacteriaceae bacterium]
MSTFNLINGTYQAVSPNLDAEWTMNLYPETQESIGAKVRKALILAPGKRIAYQLPEAGITAQYPVNGRAFVAASNLWELFADGSKVNRGSLGAMPASPNQIISNETQLLILNNGALFVFTLATNVLAPVDMSQFNGAVMQIGFTDGYGIATLLTSHTFQQSNLEDFTTWDGLNISTVSLFPDNFTSMICDHREIWFFSAKKTAAYYNAGAGNPVFIPIQGAFMEFGAASCAAFATVQLDNSIFWLDQDERGWLVARRAVGYGEQRVSTHAVEFAWQNYPNLTANSVIGYTYQEQGHSFWVLKFPNATWVYDVAENQWHQRGFFNPISGTYEADHSQSHMFVFGKHLVGDWASGNLYQQSTSIYSDMGGPLRWVRRSPTISKENKWLFFSELEIDIEPGLGPQPPLLDGDGQPRAPQIMLRWSNDGTKTWTSTFILNCGMAGEYNARARKVQLGRARRRVWEISGADPIPWRIADGYVKSEDSLELVGA